MSRFALPGLTVPAFLLLCLFLGGSTQGVWRVMVLQLVAVGLIGWAALVERKDRAEASERRLMLLAALAVLLFAVQLIPLPPGLWAALPGRDTVAGGFAAIGQGLPWLPLSLTPYDTLATAWTFLPPLAVLAVMARGSGLSERVLALTIVIGTLLGVLLGAVQTLGGFRADAWWYLYDQTNGGAVGFFANRNHMGTLLLIAIPFAAALIAATRSSGRSRGGGWHGAVTLGAGALLLILVGLALNMSAAAVMLTLPVVAFSAMLFPGSSARRRLLFIAAAGLTIVAVLLYTSSPVQAELAGSDTASFDQRLHFWTLSWSAAMNSFPFGTGLGSFERVFPLFETASAVNANYVNHAHNDYLELLVEAGLAGILLLIAFAAWWATAALRAWTSPLATVYGRAATIASGAVLAHSLVDYPLRTAAIAAVFAACLALMARPLRASSGGKSSSSRAPRHVVIG